MSEHTGAKTTIRPAVTSDLDGIFTVLLEATCRIPTNLSTSAHVEAMRKQIEDKYLGGFSLVVTDASGKIIGFQLAQKYQHAGTERYPEEVYIKLAYAGVTSAFEGQKIFRRLIEAMKGHNITLVAEVLPTNKSCMAKRLEHYGFLPTFDNEYLWYPTTDSVIG